MKFKQGAPVSAADGGDIGKVDGVVIDPETREATSLVIRKGMLFPDDRVAPLQHVAVANEDHVRLRETSDEARNLPKFEETHYVRLPDEQGPALPPHIANYAGVLLWYPPVGVMAGVDAALNYARRVQRNIPAGAVTLREGARVMTSDGKLAGWVDEIVTEPFTRQATHLLVTKGVVVSERKLIPVIWVRDVSDHEIGLATPASVIDLIRPYPN